MGKPELFLGSKACVLFKIAHPLFFNLCKRVILENEINLRGRERPWKTWLCLLCVLWVWLARLVPGLFHRASSLSGDRTTLTQSSCFPGRMWIKRLCWTMPGRQQTSPPNSNCHLWILPSIIMGNLTWPCLTSLVCTPPKMPPWCESRMDTSY